MKGRTKFSPSEATQIRELIEFKVSSNGIEQKKIRRKIRGIGFYYSRFSSKKGFDVSDFERLIENREIIILNNEPESIDKKKIFPKSDLPKSENIRILDPFEKGIFKDIRELDSQALNKTGIYCFRLKKDSKLPLKYQRLLDKTKSRIIYIGKAEKQRLSERLSQEFYHTSPGTFFRSIGAVLQFSPIPGHLKNKLNKWNYRFSKTDTEKIITWLSSNLEICITNVSTEFDIEKTLIKKYRPILNHTHNPEKSQELIDDRKNCRLIANVG